MEALDTLNRRSRFRPQRTEKRIELTARDIAIFRLLDRYRFLRSTHLHALVGGKSHKRFIERLGDLYHEGRYVDRPVQQWQSINARYMPAVYELGEAGERVLVEHGLVDSASPTRPWKGKPGVTRQFRHELMICDIMASIEMGIHARRDLRLIPTQEILARAPDIARASANPLSVQVPISYAVGGKTLTWDKPLVPDALFGIEYQREAQKQYRFFALEADCDTEPIRRNALQQSSFLRKILQYRTLIARGTRSSDWRLPNLFVLTVTTSDAHLLNMLALVNQLTGGVGSTAFLFQTLCPGQQNNNTLAFSPLQTPWKRAGHDDVVIGEVMGRLAGL